MTTLTKSNPLIHVSLRGGVDLGSIDRSIYMSAKGGLVI